MSSQLPEGPDGSAAGRTLEAGPAADNPWALPVEPPPPPENPWRAPGSAPPNPWQAPADTPADTELPNTELPVESILPNTELPNAVELPSAEPDWPAGTADPNAHGDELGFDPYRFGGPGPDPHVEPYRFGRPVDLTLPPPRGYPPTTVENPEAPPRPGTSVKAILGLVLGVASLLCCFLAFFDALIIVPAITLSVLGLREARTGRAGRGLAIAGIVFAAVGAVAALAFVVFAVSRASSCADLYPRGSTAYNSCLLTGH